MLGAERKDTRARAGAGWLGRELVRMLDVSDADLSTFLTAEGVDAAVATRLAEAQATLPGLCDILRDGRVALLGHLKNAGLALAQRQMVANALARGSREGRLPEIIPRPKPPPPPPTACMWCKADDCRGAAAVERKPHQACEKPVLRLFALELHTSVIADVEHTLEALYGSSVKIDVWLCTTRAFLFGKECNQSVRHVNHETWTRMGLGKISDFQREYGEKLRAYDGFVVTHAPVLALLYEPYGKPIICVNTCRVDQPMCWTGDARFFEHLCERLCAMRARGQLWLSSNNKADAEYLRRACGLVAPVLPSLGLYTRAAYTGRRAEWLLLGKFGGGVLPAAARALVITPHEAFGDVAMHEWAALYDMRGVVLLPWEVPCARGARARVASRPRPRLRPRPTRACRRRPRVRRVTGVLLHPL